MQPDHRTRSARISSLKVALASMLPLCAAAAWNGSLASVGVALFVSIVIAVAGSVWEGVRLDRAWSDVQALAGRLGAGDLSARLYPPRGVGIAPLYRSINGMASALQDRFSELTRVSAEQDAILRTMVEGVVVIDPQGRIRRVNSAARSLLDIAAESVEGRLVAEVIRQAEVLTAVNQAVQSSVRSSITVRLRSPSHKTLDIHSAPLISDGAVAPGMLLVIHDISRIERLENVRRDFVANVSHELRTPITSIKGFVETLLDGAVNDPALAPKFLGIIGRQAERLNSIFNDLLTLAKLEAGGEDPAVEFEIHRVGELVQAAVDDCAHLALEKGVRLEVHVPDDTHIYINKSLMGQALVNLIDNAIQYSGAGSSVQVSCACNAHTVELAVSDNGPGIEKKHLERVFERFYRVDQGRSRHQGGTGLGLAIVKHIVQIHGGKVQVESNVGRGSCFSIVLQRENNQVSV